MKVLTKDQFYSIPARAKGTFAKIQIKLEELEVGTALMVEPSDWPNKGSVGVPVSNTYKMGKSTKRFQTRSLPNKQGWAILRLA